MTPKQGRFVLEYLVDLNATQAAIRAGYSENGANVQGSQLLANPNIAEAIASEQAKRRQRLEISGDKVLQEYARIAFANTSDYLMFGPDGVQVRPLANLTEDQAAAIAEVIETRTQNGVTVKLKLHDKLRALDAMAKHLGLHAPQKVAVTNAAGDDLKPQSGIDVARAIAFIFARADAETAERDAAAPRLQ